MPTLDEWKRAITSPRAVVIESSLNLIQEVTQRQAQKDAQRQQANKPIPARKATLSPVADFEPQLTVSLTPLEMLHRLGVVTTPPVENLADLCSTWAYYRYLWAFEIPPQQGALSALKLSEAARNIDFHQKALLSDQIGVGMAALLVGSHLNAPLAADVSVALDDVNWPVDLQYDASPDYLFFDETQTPLYVVECKGTQTSRSASLEQLRRGTEQVPSLIFNDGRMPPSLVVATCLSKSGTRVLIIDPPGDSDSLDPRPEKAERTGDRVWRPRNDAQFVRANRELSEAKLLAFAGDLEAANTKRVRARAPEGRTPRANSPPNEIAENSFGYFRGTRQRLATRDRVDVEVFQGIDTTVYGAFVDEDPQRTAEELRRFRERTAAVSSRLTSSTSIITDEVNDAFSAVSAGPDGTLLQVRVVAR
jgi:hypothetical protein